MDDTSGTRVQPAGLLGNGMLNKSFRYLLVLLVLGFAWRAVFMFRDPLWVTNYWLFEDFGYSLKIARNIAMGLGETFDGVIPSNGYQPLYAWMMVPVFWVFKNDLMWPVYIAMTLLALANVAPGAFIFAIVRRLTGQAAFALLATAFWMFNLAVAKDGTNGLEAGLSVMMVAASLHYYLKHHRSGMTLGRALFLGLLLGVSFLARVDAIFLAAAVFLGMLCDRSVPARERAALLATAGIGFIVVALPYVAWNIAHFGSPLPTSGQVTTGKASLFAFGDIPLAELFWQFEYGCYTVFRILIGAPAVTGWMTEPTALGAATASTVVIVLVALCALVLVLRRAPFTLARKALLVFLLTAAFYMYGYTIHTFLAFERYFLPVALMVTLIVALAAHALINPARQGATARRVMILAALGTAYFVNAGMAYLAAPGAVPIGWYAGVAKLNEISQPGDVVAAMQTGNTGYFYRNGRAINLDGVVNLDAYRSRKEGSFDAYLWQNHVKYFADERGWVYKMIKTVADPVRRDHLLAAFLLRHRSPDTHYDIYELQPDVYTTIRKPEAPGWGRRDKEGFTGGYALVASAPGARLDFSSSGCFALKFLKHAWSGKVNLLKDGAPLATIDLYAPTEDATFRMAVKQDGMPHKYSVVLADEKNAQSQGQEVWFDAVLDQPGCGAGLATAK